MTTVSAACATRLLAVVEVAALPVVLFVRVSPAKSVAANARNAGAAAEPVTGPAKKVAADCVVKLNANVPDVVIVAGETFRIEGTVTVMLVTVPLPTAAWHAPSKPG